MPVSAIAHLKSNSPYSQSRQHFTPFLQKESDDDYSERTWRECGHYNAEGKMFIPGNQLKSCIAEAAKYLSEKIPGKGNNTWTKHFVAGLMVTTNIVLPYTRKDVPLWQGMMNGRGKKGPGPRVQRRYPEIPSWAGKIEFIILDSIITQDIFTRTLREAGNLIGIGRWRPIVGGMNGRFVVEKIEWGQLNL